MKGLLAGHDQAVVAEPRADADVADDIDLPAVQLVVTHRHPQDGVAVFGARQAIDEDGVEARQERGVPAELLGVAEDRLLGADASAP